MAVGFQFLFKIIFFVANINLIKDSKIKNITEIFGAPREVMSILAGITTEL